MLHIRKFLSKLGTTYTHLNSKAFLQKSVSKFNFGGIGYSVLSVSLGFSGFTTQSSFLSTVLANSQLNEPTKMHSEKTMVDFPNMRILVLPAAEDNFMYLLIDKASKQAAAVDPLEPATILEAIRKEKVTLTSVLTTHHHWDHAGGNKKLLEAHAKEYGPSAEKLIIYGGDDRVEALTHKVEDHEKITLGTLRINCLFTPCHTSGHMCYFVETSDMEMQKPVVFTGDTLFIGGCGRFFEGTAEQMYDALINKLGTLPAETLVFCGHEYTVSNYKFVLYIEAMHKPSQEKFDWAQKQRESKLPTVPSTIGEELQSNIFMRVGETGIQGAIAASDAISCMAKLRNIKDKGLWK